MKFAKWNIQCEFVFIVLYASLCFDTSELLTQSNFDNLDVSSLRVDRSSLIEDIINSPYTSRSKEQIIKEIKTGEISFRVRDELKSSSYLFSAIDVKFDNDDSFLWIGEDEINKAVIGLSSKNGNLSGIIHDKTTNGTYRLYDYHENLALINFESSAYSGCVQDATVSSQIIEACDFVCEDEIDVLIVLSEGARDYYGGFYELEIILNNLILEHNMILSNSNIQSKFNFLIAPSDAAISYIGGNCVTYAENVSAVPEIMSLRNLTKSDIVLYIAPPDQNWNFLACVAEFGPINELAYGVIPVDIVMENKIFSHEIGHLFGGQHSEQGSVFEQSCGVGYELTTPSTGLVSTVMEVGNMRIPHYSDPYILYEGVPTGEDLGWGEGPEFAGLLRANSCTVSDFRESLRIFSSIEIEVENCSLKLISNLDLSDESYRYEWSVSSTGIFQGEHTYIGEGMNLLVESPIPDPCIIYFIRLEIYKDEILNYRHTRPRRGGLCISNVWCGEGGDDKKGTFNDLDIDQKNVIQEEYDEIRVFNLLGQHIGDFKNILEFSSRQNSKLAFIIVYLKNGRVIDVKKVLK